MVIMASIVAIMLLGFFWLRMTVKRREQVRRQNWDDWRLRLLRDTEKDDSAEHDSLRPGSPREN